MTFLLPPPSNLPKPVRLILWAVGFALLFVTIFGYPNQVRSALGTFGTVVGALDSEALRWFTLAAGFAVVGYLTVYPRFYFWYFYEKQHGRPKEFKNIAVKIDGDWEILNPDKSYKPRVLKAVATDVIITNGEKERRTFDIELLINKHGIPGTPRAVHPHLVIKPSRNPGKLYGGTKIKDGLELDPLRTPISIDGNTTLCGYLEFYIDKETIIRLSKTMEGSTGDHYWITCAFELTDLISKKSQIYSVLTMLVPETAIEAK